MDYLIHILILISIYVIIGISLNIIAGFTGLLSIAHAAFFGIGAYSTAILSRNISSNIFLCLFLSILLTSLLGLIIGLPSLRLKYEFFVISTFGFQVMISNLMNNWTKLTNGPLGIAKIPRPTIMGNRLSSNISFLLLSIIIAAIVFILCHKLMTSPFGRVLKGIREDEILALSFGKNVNYYKILIFSLGSGLAAIGGALFAYYFSFIDPTSFTLQESIFILSIVIIGGSGNLWGSILGAFSLIGISEFIRIINIPSSIIGNLRQIFYGVLIVVFMIIKPKGILAEKIYRD